MAPASIRRSVATVVVCVAVAAAVACRPAKGPPNQPSPHRKRVQRRSIDVAKRGKLDELMKLLGPDAQPLVDASDPKTARQHREVFVVAAAEGWRLADNGPDGRVLVVGNESWPFPVPLVKDGSRWRFDSVAGVEEVQDRLIGRNELGAIRACRAYVIAQRDLREERARRKASRASTPRRFVVMPASTTACTGLRLAAKSAARWEI